MNKDNITTKVVHLFDDTLNARLKVRLRILWYLWKRESIDSQVFKNTNDILFGIQIMLRQNLYSKSITEQLEEQTLYYLFPEANRIKFSKLHQRRYLLLQRLLSFIGDYAGISFVARYGYIEYSNKLTFFEHQELSSLEDSALNLCDFLTSININDLSRVDFHELMPGLKQNVT